MKLGLIDYKGKLLLGAYDKIKMSKSNIETKLCPICQKPAEVGCILGNPNYNSIADNGLTWFQGEPGVWKNMFPLLGKGEPLGKWEAFTGSSIKGLRCNNCKKVILDL